MHFHFAEFWPWNAGLVFRVETWSSAMFPSGNMKLCNVSDWKHEALQCFRVETWSSAMFPSGKWSSAMTSFISPTAVIPWHLVGECEEFVEGVLLRAGVLLRETQKPKIRRPWNRTDSYWFRPLIWTAVHHISNYHVFEINYTLERLKIIIFNLSL